ncbi:HARBI1 [Mytilus coruscus]|uniref:Putative nuclease HARBI1 n=1 Tax=Mytilus coruscus TaxID=42192 RepID=A0A6J8CVM9_MYTCO|nr:HARBI1 [Mytilus coruscus]
MADVVQWNLGPLPRKERVFRGQDPLQMNFSDEQLRQRFRFGRESIEYISDLLRDDLQRSTSRCTALSVEEQVMISLRFFASGSHLHVIGDTMGHDKATVSRVLTKFTDALIAKRDQFIKWPCTPDKLNATKNGFYEKAGFPNVIGCVDGTHVRIQAPEDDEPSFVNRKGFHSVNVQGICDQNCLFTNVSANWPGSCHDAHVFKTSAVGIHLQDQYTSIEQGVVLGDSGYPCRPFLLTPFRQPREQREHNFNRAHITTRCTIERTFGIWKQRFRLLKTGIRMRPDRACKFILACAILHNIAMMLKEPIIDNDDIPEEQPMIQPYMGQQDGRGIRNHYATNFFS